MSQENFSGYEETVNGFSVRIVREPDPEQALELYRLAGWAGPQDNAQTIQKMFQGSFAVVVAFAPDGTQAGFMRAISDGVSDAYILDLFVRPELRKKGLGHAILALLTRYLKDKGLDWIVCIGAPGTEDFYRNSSGKEMEGFTPIRFPGV